MAAKQTEETLVILDSHAILHRAFHALPDFSSPTGEPTGALYGVTTMLLKIIEDFKPEYIVATYDLPEATHRHIAYEAYKGTRKKTDDALVAQIERSRDIFKVFGIPIFEKPGFEADDMLGSIAHYMKEHSHIKVVIASGDMDTLQCVDKKRVQVYTLKKGIKDTILYDEAMVKERFGFGPQSVPDYKGLRGDTSDNIPGIVGIGEKTATTLISHFGTIEKMYKALDKDEGTFKELGLTPRIIGLLKEGKEEAQFSKMLATIRTDAIDSFDVTGAKWREQADTTAILNLFSEFGFRTVTDRVRKLFELGAQVQVGEASDFSPQALKEAAILLWLLESERTNASYDDIVDYGRSFLKVHGFEETVKALRARVQKEGLEHIFTDIEQPLIPVIEGMQETGITLDVPYLAELSKDLHARLQKLEKSIYKHAGVEFNINSPKQLGDILFDNLGLKIKNAKKTAGGQRSTKESELEKLLGEHPIIEDILRYRELQKLVSTYIDTLPTLVGGDGKIHTTFLQTGTVTGRMGSKDPNIQNIPVKSEEGLAIRKAFTASPGYTLVAIDYSQIELRIAAILSEDKNMVEIFRKGEDVHHGVAMRVFGVGTDEVTPNMRRQAKVINFGILYGMGVNALRTNLGEDTKREEAQAFLNAYFNTFTKLAEYLEDTKTTARKLGYTETLFGRRRHFAGIASSVPFIKAAAERMAINAPIQGTAADIVRIAMVRIAEHIKKHKLEDNVHMLLQIHDELVFEIKEGEVEKQVPALLSIMERVLEGKETLGVPIVAEVKVGHNWRDMTKLKV
ncbi:MAG: polymerase polymerase protein [Candidatus Parcubacteria bacterium]|jgi:DNA polymerase-1